MGNVLLFARKDAPRERIIRPEEAGELIGVSRWTLVRWSRAGLFPAVIELGPRAIGFKSSDIQKWIESKTAAEAMCMSKARRLNICAEAKR